MLSTVVHCIPLLRDSGGIAARSSESEIVPFQYALAAAMYAMPRDVAMDMSSSILEG